MCFITAPPYNTNSSQKSSDSLRLFTPEAEDMPLTDDADMPSLVDSDSTSVYVVSTDDDMTTTIPHRTLCPQMSQARLNKRSRIRQGSYPSLPRPLLSPSRPLKMIRRLRARSLVRDYYSVLYLLFLRLCIGTQKL